MSSRDLRTANLAVSVPEIPSGASRLDYVDGLRAGAALYVVCHHAWLQVWPPEYHRSPSGPVLALTGWLMYGHFAVSAFIVISGFCLMMPVVRAADPTRPELLRFLVRRARRILPPYYCAVALALVLVWLLIGHKTGTHWDLSLSVSPLAVIASILLVQDVTGVSAVNHVFWSIAAEWHVYLLFALLLLLRARLGTGKATIAALAASCVLWVALNEITPQASIVPKYFALFILGTLICAVVYTSNERMVAIRRDCPWRYLGIGIFLLMCCQSYVWGYVLIFSTWRVDYLDVLAGVLTACILASASVSIRTPLRRVLECKPLVLVGTFSYSLYLIHAPLLQVAWQYALHPMRLGDLATFALLLLCGVPLIVGVSYLFHLLFERPFTRQGQLPRAMSVPTIARLAHRVVGRVGRAQPVRLGDASGDDRSW